jgi:phage gp29-like protein
MAKRKRDNKPDNRQALDTSQTAEVSWINSNWQEHPVVGMTPQRLHQLLTGAESGDLTSQADLFTDIEERDSHIFAELSKRKRAVTGLPWMIKPPKNASAVEKKIAEEVYDWLDDIADFEQILFDALDAIGHGYSAQTIKWERTGNIWLPEKLEFVLPRNFYTPYHSPNELRLRDVSVDGQLWDYGWLLHLHKAKSGHISRSGLFRVLAWLFLFKNYSVRDLCQLLEIYGLPIRLGKYPSGATQEEKNTLLHAVRMIGRNAGGIIPQGMEIMFEKAAEGDASNHMSMVEWCEKSASKVILGSTLTSQADGASSTNALGKIHNEVRLELVESDSKQLARSLNETLINFLMRLNFPQISPDRYPSFAFDLSQPEDIKIYSEALPKLAQVGMKIPLQWVHEKLGIPMPEDDKTPVLQIAAKASPAPAIAANSQRFKGFKLAALTQQVTEQLYPDQVLLDAAIDQLEAGELNAQAQAMIQPIMQQLEAATTIDEALDILANISPDSSPERLQENLARLLFSAEAWGMFSARDELNGG